MRQNTQNYNSNIHFGLPWYPGGASGVGVGDDIVRGIVCTMFYIFLKHR